MKNNLICFNSLQISALILILILILVFFIIFFIFSREGFEHDSDDESVDESDTDDDEPDNVVEPPTDDVDKPPTDDVDKPDAADINDIISNTEDIQQEQIVQDESEGFVDYKNNSYNNNINVDANNGIPIPYSENEYHTY